MAPSTPIRPPAPVRQWHADLFLHGYLMGANLWDPVVRCWTASSAVSPELPFGAHPTPMAPDGAWTTRPAGHLP